MKYYLLHDPEFSHLCNKEFWEKRKEITPRKDTVLHIELQKIPRRWVKMILFEKLTKQSYPIHAVHLRYSTEKIICHQRLGNTCDHYLYNAHKYIVVVTKFSDNTSKLLDQRPTCIQAEMSNTPSPHWTWDHSCCHTTTPRYLYWFWLLWDNLW